MRRWTKRLSWPLLWLLRALGRALAVLMLPLRRLGQRDWLLVILPYRGDGDRRSFHFRGQVKEDTVPDNQAGTGSRW